MGAVKVTVSIVADKEAAKIEQWKRQVILKHAANTRQAWGVNLHSLSAFMSRLALAFVMMRTVWNGQQFPKNLRSVLNDGKGQRCHHVNVKDNEIAFHHHSNVKTLRGLNSHLQQLPSIHPFVFFFFFLRFWYQVHDCHLVMERESCFSLW